MKSSSAWVTRFVTTVTFLVLGHSTVDAHIIGDQAWCVRTSAIHMVCEFADRKSCGTGLQVIARLMTKFKAPDNEGAAVLPPACVENPQPKSNSSFEKGPTAI